LIKDEIDHEKVDSSVVTSSGPSESSRADYGFIVIHTDSSSSESSKFPAMIQQVITSVFFLLLVIWSLCLSPVYLY